jgi:hypothetical protein
MGKIKVGRTGKENKSYFMEKQNKLSYGWHSSNFIVFESSDK